MRPSNLPSPGLVHRGLELRNIAAAAVSAVETVAAKSGGITSGANSLHAFFTACATAVNSFRDTVTPTVSARNAAATAPKLVIVTFSEGLRSDTVPLASAFTFSPANPVTGAYIDGTKLYLTVTNAVANGNTIAYTQPATEAAGPKLQDIAGNLVATWAASAITVA